MKVVDRIVRRLRSDRGRRITMPRLALGLLASVLAGVCSIARANAQATQLGTAFTYQGQLVRDGAPPDGSCDFRFGLFDAPSGGHLQGTALEIPNVAVNGGVFTVHLDFGDQFKGSARWLATAVRCIGDVDFVALAPLQPLTPAPYALSLRPGAHVEGSVDSGALTVSNTTPPATMISGVDRARPGERDSGTGRTFSLIGAGADGIDAFATTGIGVRADGGSRAGVLGTTTDPMGSGVEGGANGAGAAGVLGTNNGGTGVLGRVTGGAYGVYGDAPNGIGVGGVSTFGDGVSGTSDNHGVSGTGFIGLLGNSNGTENSQAVRAVSHSATDYAGVFDGRVSIIGTLFKTSGAFRIDHPLDPTNKYLNHSFVESPDMKNIYDGIATLDENGEVVVELPDWFEALNQDFRYQLTCVGGYAPVYVAEEISHNRFRIGGGREGLKVSWQVTGIRHDAYANQNRIQVEEDKPAAERGTYMFPQAFGQPMSMQMPLLRSASAPVAVTLPQRERADASE
jgi:hypothetical protein